MIGKIVRESGSLVLLVMPVWVAFSLLNRLRTRRPDAGDAPGDTFWWFGTYVILLALLTLAPPPISRSNGHFGSNLVPLLYSARCFVPNPGQPSTTAFCLESIIGNLALFVPLGFLLPLNSDETASAGSIVGVAMVASVSIELLQYAGRFVGNPRWSDVDDVIFNVLGAVVGYALLRLVQATRISTRFDSN